MSLKLLASFAALIVAWTISVTQALALDDRIPGVWTTTVVKPQGQWSFTWHVARDGTYRTVITGTFPLPDEYGRLATNQDVWSIKAVGGRDDRGCFEFIDD